LNDARALTADAAHNFRIDVKGAQVRNALRDFDVRSILLKGGAFSALLYESPGDRKYNDVDLLIDPSSLDRAFAALTSLGFTRFDKDSPSSQTDPALGALIGALGAVHGAAWVRDEDGVVVDLHLSLPQVTASSTQVWEQITKHVALMSIGDATTEVLDRPASALMVALHAAHHGPKWGPCLGDLRRALETFERSIWTEAFELARALGAERAFGVGLALDGDGKLIAAQLGLETEAPQSLVDLWVGEPWTRIIVSALRREPSWRKRTQIASRLLCPSPEAMRNGSQLARRGLIGLVAAYLTRPLQLAALAARSRNDAGGASAQPTLPT
jgi:hypothetical protein